MFTEQSSSPENQNAQANIVASRINPCAFMQQHFQRLQHACVEAQDHLSSHLHKAQSHLAPLQQNAVLSAQAWWNASPLARFQRKEMTQALQGPWAPMFASLSAATPFMAMNRAPRLRISTDDTGSSSAMVVSNALMDLAMAKEEVKERLARIPVYTVANPKNEFVLVAGENNTQLGFFFLNQDDAKYVIERIREENPRLARDAKILKADMGNVYEVFVTPREETGLEGIHFRFMPDMGQVANALELYKEAGLPMRTFVGVPVFQAEGLTVKTQEMEYVPLFLSKEDLGVAVQTAYSQRNAAQIKVYTDKARRYEDEYNEVLVQVGSATGSEKSALELRAERTKSKLEIAREKAEAIERAPWPRVEVGSLEDVMARMTQSTGSDLTAWGQALFVEPGLLQNAADRKAKIADQK